MERNKLVCGKVRRACGGILATACLGPIAPDTVLAQAQTRQDRIEHVGNLLVNTLSRRGPTVEMQGWPPRFTLENPGCPGTCAKTVGNQRVVYVAPEHLDVFGPNDDLLAFVVGHELGHHVLGHLEPTPNERRVAQVAEQVLNQQNELDADQWGMALAEDAGYDERHALWGLLSWFDRPGDHSGFRSLVSTHPSWSERAEFLNLFLGDEEQAALWARIGTFHDGVSLLSLQQYEPAAAAFEAVVRVDSTVAEAWANLGYARLMQYCDLLEPEDIETFGYELGHLVADGFYTRPISLEQRVRQRAIRADLWRAGVEALEVALRLEPRLSLARANLGLAYLVGPEGRRDLEVARRLLERARFEARNDAGLPPLKKAAIDVNYAAVELAEGNEIGYAAHLRDVEAAVDPTDLPALLYALARVLVRSEAREDLQRAEQLLRSYLKSASRASLWWEPAREEYVRTVERLGIVSEVPDFSAEPDRLRPVTGITLSPEVTIRLGQPISDVVAQLGDGRTERIVRGRSLMRHSWQEQGLELLALRGRVLLIRLVSGPARIVQLRAEDLGTAEAGFVGSITLGQPVEQVAQVLGDRYARGRRPLIDARFIHRYYPDAGLAVRIADGRVAELVVVQMVGHVQ